MIPGLEQGEFLRLRKHPPERLREQSRRASGPALTAKDDDLLFFAGPVHRCRGYTESLGTGLLAGINLARRLRGLPSAMPPVTTMLGGLYRYLREADPRHFQPMNANFGLLDPIEKAKGRDGKEARKQALVERALADFQTWSSQL